MENQQNTMYPKELFQGKYSLKNLCYLYNVLYRVHVIYNK